MPPPVDRDGLVGVAATLLLIQGAILVTGVIEAWIFASFVGSTAVAAAVLTAAGATLVLTCAWGLGRARAWARRATLIAEGAIFAIALLDVVAAPILVGAGVSLVPFLTRLVLPLAVISILRRPAVRVSFAVAGAPA